MPALAEDLSSFNCSSTSTTRIVSGQVRTNILKHAVLIFATCNFCPQCLSGRNWQNLGGLQSQNAQFDLTAGHTSCLLLGGVRC